MATPRLLRQPAVVAPERAPIAADRVLAGDAFLIPAGFRGNWEVVETITKRFVIHDPL